MKPVKAIAHRGASGVRTENTIPAFLEAVDQGADALEMDIRRCRSGELVVFHDDDLSRLAGVRGPVEGLTLAELRQLRLRDSRLPGSDAALATLDDVVTDPRVRARLTCGDGFFLCLEIKGQGIESTLVEFIRDRDLCQNVVVYSFDVRQLVTVRAIDSQLPVNLLFGEDRAANLQLALDNGIPMINPERPDADREYVERAVARGLTVTVGRTNDVDALRRLVALPIWGIHSDFPDRAVKAIRDRQGRGSSRQSGPGR